jgi:hypothetical protein
MDCARRAKVRSRLFDETRSAEALAQVLREACGGSAGNSDRPCTDSANAA